MRSTGPSWRGIVVLLAVVALLGWLAVNQLPAVPEVHW
jgi:hypothetical protein